MQGCDVVNTLVMQSSEQIIRITKADTPISQISPTEAKASTDHAERILLNSRYLSFTMRIL